MAGFVTRDVPLTPSADEAQAWAEAELAKGIYNDEPTILERLADWLWQLWEQIVGMNSSLGPVLVPLVVLAVVGVLAVVALLLGGPVRRRRLARAGSSEVLSADDDRSAADLRAAAEAAARAGDFSRAVLERFRAIVRGMDERVILEDRPGRTAHEAAVDGGTRLPACAEQLLSASRLFDEVCYGHTAPTAADYEHLCEVDRAVGSARPQRERPAAVGAP
ncbi:DUF4129 domain-containing protein [Ruania alba]|uniref:Protein-glutamine gamma-glutamyltransferase-like C-terminal domain-containing protein n=1 Tax=Ruania alba TaxID=648782 RepID=A0A1H5NBD6_9MICO|nr:DUF4129 domain-containing protein [Ruania alba]SEE98876.1 protein of unknown function [Ruania alba]